MNVVYDCMIFMYSKRHSTFRRGAFALIELPLVLCLLLGVVGIIIGAFLWHRNGTVTVGAWIGFSLILPLCALLGLVFYGGWQHRRRNK